MTDALIDTDGTDQADRRYTSKAPVIGLLLVAVVLGLVLGRLVAPSQPGSNGSLTATENDAMADYQAAVATGRPVYVLFHSLN